MLITQLPVTILVDISNSTVLYSPDDSCLYPSFSLSPSFRPPPSNSLCCSRKISLFVCLLDILVWVYVLFPVKVNYLFIP